MSVVDPWIPAFAGMTVKEGKKKDCEQALKDRCVEHHCFFDVSVELKERGDLLHRVIPE